MYELFFNLTKKPFDLLPNPDFLYPSKSHKRALSYLDYGIRERVGFILLTGEVGSGKTTIIRDLIKKRLSNVLLSKIFNTRVDSEQLISMINDDFGLQVNNKNKITLLRELNDFLIEQYVRGNMPVLIIDEAQNLSPDLLEEIRMLSNLETDNAKLLQIILVGQPELRTTLAMPSMVQLRQRISINCHIHPLTRLETELYIFHRLEKAGNRDAISFPTETFDVIFAYSRGIPRLINIICDFLMLSAFADQTRNIDVKMVKDIIGDLDFEHHFWGDEQAAIPVPVNNFISPAITTAQVGQDYSAMIRDFSERINYLSRESEQTQNALLEEMTTKIATIEQSVKFYREETDAHINALLEKREVAEDRHKDSQPNSEEDKNRMGSLLRRILGV